MSSIMFKLSYFKYPFLYSILFFLAILVGSFSSDYSNYSDISKQKLYLMWGDYFAGLFTTFSIICVLSSLFNRNLNQIILTIVILRNSFFEKIINSFKSKLYKNFSFSDFIILIILSIGLFMGIESIFHYIDRIEVVGSRIFDRYYITKTTQTLFLITSVTSFLQIVKQTKFKKIGYFTLVLGSFTQSFVDHSRFFVLPFVLLSFAFLYTDINTGRDLKRTFLNAKNSLTINKIYIFKFLILLLFGFILVNIINERFNKYSAFFTYFTSTSFYGIGAEIGNSVFSYQNLFFGLSGIPVKILNFLGFQYEIYRIAVTIPLNGILALSALNNSFFISGTLTACILSLPLTLIKFVNSLKIQLFCFIFLCSSIVTLPQYDLRASLRLLQILLIVLFFAINAKKKYVNSKKLIRM